ncbi:MAG: PEGA domain-containing protein [Halanaerobiales bacterium]|nr:PEGA domain-containing protein [Halanaerobiales bacterium]
MKKLILIFLILAIIVGLGGCYSFTLKRITETNYGSLNITSEPTGADVYINGEYKGQTPLYIGGVVTGLEKGEYTILFEKEGYESIEKSIIVDEEKEYSVHSSLPYTVSGKVTFQDVGVEGVVIFFGDDLESVVTDSDGYWSKSGLQGERIVTAKKEEWLFNPVEYKVDSANDSVNLVGLKTYENAKILDAEDIKDLDSVSENGSILTFKKSAPIMREITEDNILLIGVTPETPYGLLCKVTNVELQNNKYIVETESASLNDLIEEGTLEVTGRLLPRVLFKQTLF